MSIIVFIIWLLLEYQIFNQIFYIVDLSTLLQLFTTVLLTVIVLKNDIKNTNLQATAVLSHYDTTVEKLIAYLDAINDSLNYLKVMKSTVEKYHETFVIKKSEDSILKEKYHADYQSLVRKLNDKSIDIKYCINHIRLYDESIMHRPAIKLLWSDYTGILNYDLDGIEIYGKLDDYTVKESVGSELKFEPIDKEVAKAYFLEQGQEHKLHRTSDEEKYIFVPMTVRIHDNFWIMQEVHEYLNGLVEGLIEKNNAVRQDILKNSLE